MEPIVYRLSLDVHGVDPQGILPVKIGDTARALMITLRERGVPYVPQGEVQALLTARKADGKILMEPCRVTEEGIYYPFSSQLTAVVGETLCELRLYGEEGQLLTCPRFVLMVSDQVVKDGEIVESSSEFRALTELLEETRQIRDRWEELLEKGESPEPLPQALEDFAQAMEVRQTDPLPGLPVFDGKGGFCSMEIHGEAQEEGTYALPTVGTLEQRLWEWARELGSGLDFDGGYVDEECYMHLTLGGKEVEAFEPVYIGEADQGAEDLILEGDRLYLMKDGEPMGEGVTLPAGGGTGSGTGSTMKLLSRNPNSSFSVMDTAKEAMILFSWSSVDTEDSSPTGKGSASWFVGDKRVATQSVEQGDGSFDILPYLETGVENTVKLTIEDAYGTSRSRIWTVTVISFGLSWDLEPMSCHPSAEMSIRLVPSGMGDKTLTLTIDGEVHDTRVIASTGRTVTVDLPPLSHGAHRLSATLSLVTEGETISTEPLEHLGIWYEEGNTEPVVAFFHETLEIPQYATVSAPYLVYDPLREQAGITLYENGAEVRTLTVGRRMENWAYRPTAEGVTTLKIGVTAKPEVQDSLTVTVTALGYDIAPVTAGLVLECSPAGHSNSESNRETFGYRDGKGANHPFLFSENFDWENGGFRQDEEGVTALVIKRGSTVTLDRSFFQGDATAKGRQIKLILKTKACKDYEAQFLTCEDQGIGLILKAQEGILSSESQRITFPYCEEEKLEIDLNIESAKENRLATVWLRGVPSGVFAYAPSDSWAQGIPKAVVIGSPHCDVWLYGIRMYDNSLTRYDILANYIADAGTTEEMIRRYERNDIYNTGGTISLRKLEEANPELRILHIQAGDMTTSKTHEVTCKVDLSHKNGMGFSASGVVMKAQGTSSLEYGLAALNLDLDFSEADWRNDKGDPITGFSMEESSIPVNYFNIKLNVASSENANNVCLAQEYNTFNPYVSQPRLDNNADPTQIQKIRDTVEGNPCAVFFTNTSGKTIAVGARTVASGEMILYGCGDMNNSKKNFAVFGQDNSRYPQQCCIEILNNNNDPCRFKSDDLTGETWDGGEGTSNFEFRYPKHPTEEMKAAFQRLLSWVVSTDPAQATGEALLRPVQFHGVTYNTDSSSYRLAKFRGELGEHFSVESLLFHYLFTEFHLMVDNRAKNTFLSYEWDSSAGGYRWNFNKDYDNDTAAGTDNSGGLTFRYGLEDGDSVGAQMVYNASDSVLWCNLRDTMGEELKAMFHRLESQKAWDTDRILEHFRTYQSARPEILVAEDMWAKYFMPYINQGEKRYLEMAQGTKAYQRGRFYRYQRPYLSSKYLSSYATSDSLSLRINAVSDFTLTPYSDVYACVKFGNASLVKLRAKRGEEILIPCNADTTNDLETYLYSAGSISRLGDLSGLQTSEIELNSAVKLRNLPLGSSAPGYENDDLTQLSFGTIGNLESIDLSGLGKLGGTLDLSQFDGLQELYAAGSGISGVIFAPNAPVTTAILPRVGTLILRGQTKLEILSLDGSKLLNLRVEDSPKVDSLALVRSAMGLQRGRITNVRWDTAEGDTLLRLAQLGGYDEGGTPCDRFVLTGSAHVPTICEDELRTLHQAFPNLELTYGEMVPAYTATFCNEDGTVLHTQLVRKGGTCHDPVATGKIPAPTKAPTVGEEFYFKGWDFPLTNIQSDMVFTALFSSVTRRYTVRWFDGSRLLQTDVVQVYEGVSYRGEDLASTEADVIWIGWDKSQEDLDSVVRDLDVYATYMAPLEEVPRREGYDYIYSDDPNDNSGFSLQEFYTIITKGLAKEYFQVGDLIKICTKTNVFADLEIVLQLYGFHHFKLADNSGDFAKVVFGMKGVMNAGRAMNATNTNVGGWKDSAMGTYLNEQVFPALPQRWKAMIKTVEVRSSAGGTSQEILTSQNKLFLFSRREVSNTTAVPYRDEVDEAAEDKTFSLFTGTASRDKKTFNGTGESSCWWLRSPNPEVGTSFCRVSKATSNGIPTGTINTENASVAYSSSTGYQRISFGFCI